MAFEREAIPGTLPGSVQWVQVIDSTTRRKRYAPGEPNAGKWLRFAGTNILDTTYPYYGGPSTTTTDSPSTNGNQGFDRITAVDKFSMYLMYRPTVAAPAITSEWVPLKVTVWDWAGDAERDVPPPNITLNSKTDPTATTTDTTIHPTWSGNATGLGYELEQ